MKRQLGMEEQREKEDLEKSFLAYGLQDDLSSQGIENLRNLYIKFFSLLLSSPQFFTHSWRIIDLEIEYERCSIVNNLLVLGCQDELNKLNSDEVKTLANIHSVSLQRGFTQSPWDVPGLFSFVNLYNEKIHTLNEVGYRTTSEMMERKTTMTEVDDILSRYYSYSSLVDFPNGRKKLSWRLNL